MEGEGYSKAQEAQYPQQDPYPQPGYGPGPQPGYNPDYPPAGVAPPPQYQPPVNYGQTIQGATYVQQTGTVGVTTVVQSKPNNYMGLAIFVTVCCCWPIGIFAIMKASQVGSLFYSGNIAGAEEASKSARTLSYVSLGCGIASIVISVVIVLVYYLVILNAIASRSNDY